MCSQTLNPLAIQSHTWDPPTHRGKERKSRTRQVPENPKSRRQMIQRTICVREPFIFSLNLLFQLYLLWYRFFYLFGLSHFLLQICKKSLII